MTGQNNKKAKQNNAGLNYQHKAVDKVQINGAICYEPHNIRIKICVEKKRSTAANNDRNG